ncbi:transposase, partial [Nonomuraea sp. NPDC051941]|uniref:transposase n=1 Tax=Nonomuraea sp. NPDC051941 TaxID=3364373 RepID=UPI0037CC92E3
FATAAKLAAWSGLAPGNHESAGKRKSGRRRHGVNDLVIEQGCVHVIDQVPVCVLFYPAFVVLGVAARPGRLLGR